MSASVVPFSGGGASRIVRHAHPAGREGARVERQAACRAAQVQAVAFVSHISLQQVANLSNLEAELIRQVPLAEARLQSVVDTATNVMTAIVARMVWE